MKSAIGCLIATAALCWGQTRIDLSTQTRTPNFSQMSSTRPVQVGAQRPATCVTGEMFFDAASAAGRNLYGCAALNTWVQLSNPATQLGGCTVDETDTLTCPGDILSATGAVPGEIALYEKMGNGWNFISWTAPESVSDTYRLQLPAEAPTTGQALQFAGVIDGIAAGQWVRIPTVTRQSTYMPAAQPGLNNTWNAGAGWTLPADGTAAVASGISEGIFPVGYLIMSDAAIRRAGLQTKLPDDWDNGLVTLAIVWTAPGAASGATTTLGLSSACIGDGQSLRYPIFGQEQLQTVITPYVADTNSRRVLTTFGVDTTGCAPGTSLHLLICRKGIDSHTGNVMIWGVEMSFGRHAQ